MAYLLLYVDDIVLIASSTAFLHHIVDRLRSEFALIDLRLLHFFLGLQVHRTPTSFFLHQQKYALDILDRAGMSASAATPVNVKPKLSALAGNPALDASFYRSIVGTLQYLTMTRPYLAYAINQAYLHMHAPHDVHWALVKRILWYVCGTVHRGLVIIGSKSSDIVAYFDADWAGCLDTRCSTSRYCVFLGDSLVSWSSKRQPTVSHLSAEAEYHGVANAVAETCWLRQLLTELHSGVDKATIVYCDNISATYLASNPVPHRCTKHIELDVHFVREKVALGELRVLHVPSTHQFTDIMTKGLPTLMFDNFCSSLCISDDATTAGCY
ncbi:uncharacterized mitochondrial protein AtMg00810-like [Phragmites australis]|uniref:uncharacterized mitochondrial protein AtMg00810-like n=1 Tax=Phragmites australis TaxID=29695 RepID=UPI002D795D9B|nr:uncharacterized mitochondrial protein AtMg00810-like [Phragmites australis]